MHSKFVGHSTERQSKIKGPLMISCHTLSNDLFQQLILMVHWSQSLRVGPQD